jgi:hypothetical protein
MICREATNAQIKEGMGVALGGHCLAVSLLSQFVESINVAEEAQKAKIKEQNDKQSTDRLLRNILRVETRFNRIEVNLTCEFTALDFTLTNLFDLGMLSRKRSVTANCRWSSRR